MSNASRNAEGADRTAAARPGCRRRETWNISIPRLQTALEHYGRIAYLLTVSEDGRPHCTAVATSWIDDALVARPGSQSLANATLRPNVTLLWPPATWGAYSLIVDARAVIATGHAGDTLIRFHPTRAVRHPRPDLEDRGSPLECEPV
jgi:hypothetical protein